MAGSGTADGVDRIGDTPQGRIGADGRVGPRHIIVDRPHHADHGQAPILVRLRGGDQATGYQRVEELRPVLLQSVRARKAPVAADDHQVVDPPFNQVHRCLLAPFRFTKCLTAGRPNRGAPLVQNAADRFPVQGTDAGATVHHALVAFIDGIHLDPAVECGACHRPYGCVHAGGVAPTGQNTQADGLLHLGQVEFSVVEGEWA